LQEGRKKEEEEKKSFASYREEEEEEEEEENGETKTYQASHCYQSSFPPFYRD